MNFSQAVIQLKEGKKVRRKKWEPHKFLYRDNSSSQLIRDWEENTKWFYPQDRLVMAYEEIDMLDVKKNIQLKLRKRKNE